MPGIFYTLGLNNSGLVSGLIGATNAVRSLIGTAAGLAGIGGGLVGLGTAALGLTKALSSASDDEGLFLVMRRLLKDGEAAKRMVQDLTKFSDITPFEPGPVKEAGKQLLAFGFQAKDIIPILTDVGDLAAGMDKPLEEVADAFGRLKAGQFGEAFEAFRRFGISLEALKGEGLKFDGGGQFKGSAAAAMEAVRNIIRSRFGGAMDDLSQSTGGLFSTLKGAWDTLFREFGGPVNQALKPFIEAATAMATRAAPAAKAIGEGFANALTTARKLFENGQLGEMLGLAVKIGLGEAVNFGVGALKGLAAGFGVALATAGRIGAEVLAAMTTPQFWAGMGAALVAIAFKFAAIVDSAVAAMLSGMAKVPGFGFLQSAADFLNQAADSANSMAKSAGGDAKNLLSPLTGNITEMVRDGFDAGWESFMEQARGSNLVDTAKLKEQWRGAMIDAQNNAYLDKLGKDIEQSGKSLTSPETSKGAEVAKSAFSKQDVVSDKLSKVGGFIGGNGGPRGQRAAEDTARNTRTLVEQNKQLITVVQSRSSGSTATF